MAQVDVYVKETLCKKIHVWVPDDLTVDERLDFAEEKIREAYENDAIVLTADDYNGETKILLQDFDSKTETDWNNI